MKPVSSTVLIVASIAASAFALGEAPGPRASIVLRVAPPQGWYAIDGYQDADECQRASRLAKLTSANNVSELTFVAEREVAIGIIYNETRGSDIENRTVRNSFGGEQTGPAFVTKLRVNNVILKFVPKADGRYEIALDIDAAGNLHWKASQQDSSGEWVKFNPKAVRFAMEMEGKLQPKIVKSCKGNIPVVEER